MGIDLQKVKAALEVGLCAVVMAGQTRYQKDEADEIREALAELEKPADDYDLSECASDIQSSAWDWEIGYEEVKRIIQQYAEAYHAKKCAACKDMKSLYVKFGNEMPPDECLSCGRQCPNDCPLDRTTESTHA